MDSAGAREAPAPDIPRRVKVASLVSLNLSRSPRTGQQLKVLAGRAQKTLVNNPVRLVPLGFLAAIALGTLLLMLPVSRVQDGDGGFMPAVFTAVSAVCVTGLVTVDTPTYWTPVGQGIILLLIQVGGFGIMTLSSLLALLVRKHLGLRTQLIAASETQAMNLGDVRRVLVFVAKTTFAVESVVAIALSARFWVINPHDPMAAIWGGIFHSISAFNNAGFALYSDSLISHASDPWIMVPLCLAVVLGGLGFPVIHELLRRNGTKKSWSVHTLLTVWGTVGLLAAGALLLGMFEFNRSETLGGLSPSGKVLGVLGLSVFPRTAGFNNIDYGQASPETLLVTDVLMFIGGGSAGTAGGIKISTFLVLAFAVWSEARGHDQITVWRRAIGSAIQRQALSVALLGLGAVVAGTLALLVLTDHSTEEVLFESVSAFATVGVSMGITADLPTAAQWVIISLMFIGRVGIVSAAAALALRGRRLLFKLPEEQPVIG